MESILIIINCLFIYSILGFTGFNYSIKTPLIRKSLLFIYITALSLSLCFALK